MLRWLWQIFDNPAAAETRLLKELLRSAPEFADWSAAVQPVLARLSERNRIGRSLRCRVLDMPVFNAFALPHRTVVVSQLLVEFCRDERDQMGFVLAHEAAHIQLGHARERSHVNALLTAVRTANPLLGMGVRMLFERAYSREQEFEADKLAVSLCAKAGYDPRAALVFLSRLGSAELPGNLVSRLVSTHPPLQERIGQLGPAAGRSSRARRFAE